MSNKISFVFKGPQESPGYLLAQVTMLWQRKLKKILDPLDLTHTQFILLATLAWLSNQQEEITQVDIAAHNQFDRMMVSKVLRTLEGKKLIGRQEHHTDTRAKMVKLTPNGRKLLQAALVRVEHADLDFFSVLKAKQEDFNASLSKLIHENKEV